MLTFAKICQWEGVNRSGQRVSGKIAGEQIDKVRVELQHQGILVTKLTGAWRVRLVSAQLSIKETADFSRQLAYLLHSDFPLLLALDAVSGQYSSSVLMQTLLAELKINLENGMTFSSALLKHPHYFSKLYVHLIEVGEKCGDLPDQLLQLSNYQEKMLSIRRSIYKSLYYPVSLLGVSILVILLLIFLVIPQFESLFTTMGVRLPYLTRALIKMTHGIQSYGVSIALSGVGLGALIVLFRAKLERWLVTWDTIILKLPWVGSIVQEAVLARFARTLSTTLKAQLPILEALATTKETLEYTVYTSAISQAQHAIMAGVSLDRALAATQCFPPLLIQTIEIGQLSGHLDKNLEQLAHYLETKVHESTVTMIRFLEPTLLLILGVFIGIFMFALYKPIFELGNVVGIV